jgi:hypothetical protein
LACSSESHNYERSEVSMFEKRMQLQLVNEPSFPRRIGFGKALRMRQTRPNDQKDQFEGRPFKSDYDNDTGSWRINGSSRGLRSKQKTGVRAKGFGRRELDKE